MAIRLSLRARRRPVCVRGRACTFRSSPAASLFRKNTHPHPLNFPTLSLFSSHVFFSQQASISPSAPQLPPTPLFTNTASELFFQAALLAQLTQNSRIAVFQKRKADVMETENSRKNGFDNGINALEEETIAWKAIISAVCAVKKRVQRHDAELVSFKEVSHETLRKSPSALLQHFRQKARPTFWKHFHPSARALPKSRPVLLFVATKSSNRASH